MGMVMQMVQQMQQQQGADGSTYDKPAVDQTSAMADLPVRWVPTTAMLDPLTALDADAHSGDGSLFGTSDALATSDFLLI